MVSVCSHCLIAHVVKKPNSDTVEPVLRGHCVKGSPALSSHLLGSLEPNYNADEPVLRGHLS